MQRIRKALVTLVLSGLYLSAFAQGMTVPDSTGMHVSLELRPGAGVYRPGPNQYKVERKADKLSREPGLLPGATGAMALHFLVKKKGLLRPRVDFRFEGSTLSPRYAYMLGFGCNIKGDFLTLGFIIGGYDRQVPYKTDNQNNSLRYFDRSREFETFGWYAAHHSEKIRFSAYQFFQTGEPYHQATFAYSPSKNLNFHVYSETMHGRGGGAGYQVIPGLRIDARYLWAYERDVLFTSAMSRPSGNLVETAFIIYVQ